MSNIYLSKKYKIICFLRRSFVLRIMIFALNLMIKKQCFKT